MITLLTSISRILIVSGTLFLFEPHQRFGMAALLLALGVIVRVPVLWLQDQEEEEEFPGDPMIIQQPDGTVLYVYKVERR